MLPASDPAVPEEEAEEFGDYRGGLGEETPTIVPAEERQP